MKKYNENHFFHMVELSPWPILLSFFVYCLMLSLLSYINCLISWSKLFLVFLVFLFTMSAWMRDVVIESTFQGFHTQKVMRSMILGMLMFIVSEVMFFFSFFWCFFNSSVFNLSIEMGAIWPPLGFFFFNPLGIPLLNTLVLLFSGISITWSHHCVYENKYKECLFSMLVTLILGVYFTYLQYSEYYESTFSISDSVFGSIFFVATGFHGLHVIVGSLMIMVSFFRMLNKHFNSKHHLGFEFSIWYWHFVDVVWLYLYIFVYCWGN